MQTGTCCDKLLLKRAVCLEVVLLDAWLADKLPAASLRLEKAVVVTEAQPFHGICLGC